MVGQNALIRPGWPDSENRVSLNTLYQAISHLRKELAVVLPQLDIITTVKRTGILFSAEIQVELLNQQHYASIQDPAREHNLDENTLKKNNLQPPGKAITLYIL